MTQSQGNNFDASDIQRYHSGQMSTAERHALEKAALDDPFLADAIEGYTYTATATEDFATIRKRLEQKTTKRKVIPLFTRTWMRVAALLFVVAGGVWLVLSTQNDSSNAVAIEKLQQKKNAEDKSASGQATFDSITKDLNSNDGNASEQMTVLKNEKPEKTKESLPPPSYYNVTTDKVSNSKNESSSESNVQNQSSYRQPPREVASGFSNNTRNSRNINEANKTMPQANAQERLTNNQASSNRITTWADTDSVSNITAQKREQSDSVRHLNVVMTPQPSAPLNEVVISKTVAKKESEMKGRMAGVVIDTLEPAEGWTNFDDYIAGNLKVPDELKLKPINNGEVELSFEVNQKGEPINITVTKSLCEKCDEEAKRLLKEGPKWKKKKNKKGRVTIRF